MKKLLVISSLFIALTSYSAGTLYSTKATHQVAVGSWFDANNWNTGIPVISNNNEAIIGNETFVAGNLTISSQNFGITINAGAALVITGDLIFDNNDASGYDINVASNGVLIVLGSIKSLRTNMKLNINSQGVIATVKTVVHDGKTTDISNNGHLYVFQTPEGIGNNDFESVNKTISKESNMIPNGHGWILDKMKAYGYGGSTPMPIEFSSFTVIGEGQKVLCSWVTASETNNDFFSVEHSADGIVWTGIATVDGSGTTSIDQSYSFTHVKAPVGLNYYRIKQTDYDGVYSYSDIKSVTIEEHENESDMIIKIFPNPAIHFLNVESKSDVTKITVYDNVMKGVVSSTSNSVDVSNLGKGYYTLYVELSNGEKSNFRFVKE